LAGELGMADADQVGQVLTEAVESGKPVVRLDIAELSFADSSAIKAILIGALGADERGVTFQLVNPVTSSRRCTNPRGLTDVLTIVHEPAPT
jgi:anti-sigma B factor antagonist